MAGRDPVFHGLPPESTQNVSAVRALMRRLLPLPTPRSLAEVAFAQSDYAWLRLWAADLKHGVADSWTRLEWNSHHIEGRYWSARDVLGLLLLALASEVGRREATEGKIWAAVRSCFSANTQKALFDKSHPRQCLYDALEGAALKAGLRHAFGQHDTQAYYLTIFLQFGFTRSGLRRLPNWLSGDATSLSVAELKDPESGSGEFLGLWTILDRLRKGNVSESVARKELSGNPFILPEWVDETVKAAQAAVIWGYSGDQEDGEDASFVDEPHLCWDEPDDPVFRLGMQGLAHMALVDEGYDVLAGEDHVGKLFRRDDGTYECEPEQFDVHADQDFVPMRLKGDGQPADDHNCVTPLWPEGNDLLFFSAPQGRPVAPTRIDPDQALFIVAPSEARLDPKELGHRYRRLPKVGRTVYSLPAGGARSLRVLVGDEVVWAYEGGIRPCRAELVLSPLYSKRVVVGDMVRCRVCGLSEDAVIRKATLGSREVHCDKGSGGWQVRFRLDADLARIPVVVWFVIQEGGRQKRARGLASIDCLSVSRKSDGAWRTLSDNRQLTASDGRESLFRVLTPHGSDPVREWAILEGDVIVRRAGSRPFVIGNFQGYGAALRLQKGPFNAIDRNLTLPLVREVVDHGELRDFKARDGRATFRFRRSLEPDADHSLVWWDFQDRIVVTSPVEDAVGEDNVWEVPVPEGLDPVRMAVSVAYRGSRIGTWWTNAFQLPKAPEDPCRVAGLLRWMHLPVLSVGFRKQVNAMAKTHARDFLQAWVLDEALEDLQLSGCGAPSHDDWRRPQWTSVIRQTFGEWDVPQAQCVEIYGDLYKTLKQSPLPLLGEASARFAFKVGLGCSREQALARPLDFAADSRRVLGLGAQATDAEVKSERDALLSEAVRQLRVDDGFVRHFLRRIRDSATPSGKIGSASLTELDQENLDLASGVTSFRRLLAHDFLSWLDQNRGRARDCNSVPPSKPGPPANGASTRGGPKNAPKIRVRIHKP